MDKFATLIVLLALVGGTLFGCSDAEVQVTKQQEEDFRNPPKEIPPENLKAMQEAREKGMRKAQEMRDQAGK